MVQLRQELENTKAQLKDLVNERDETLQHQRAAALGDAQDEVASLKRVVDNLDSLLEKATNEKRRLQDQLRLSEDRVDEQEDQVRILKRRQTQKENNAPQSNGGAAALSPKKIQEQKPRQMSTSRKSMSLAQNQFLITIKNDAEKLITRPKKGSVPVGLG